MLPKAQPCYLTKNMPLGILLGIFSGILFLAGLLTMLLLSLLGGLLILAGVFLGNFANDYLLGIYNTYCPHCQKPARLRYHTQHYTCPACNLHSCRVKNLLIPIRKAHN